MLPLLGNAESVPYAPPYRTAAPVAYVASSQAPEHHNLLISALYISVCIYLSVFLLFKKKKKKECPKAKGAIALGGSPKTSHDFSCFVKTSKEMKGARNSKIAPSS